MLGVVFTEFLDMVETKYSPATLDRIIQRAALPHGGAYTAVGDYPHPEMVRLAISLSEESGTPLPELLEIFGAHLFGCLASAHPALLAERPSLFDLLGHLNDTIHPEVQRLHPKAELPRFKVIQRDGHQILLRYDSPRRMEALAKGLILGAARHYGVDVVIRLDPVEGPDPHVLIHVENAD